MNRAALRISLALVVLSASPAAFASLPFPDEIKAQLQLTEAPLCTLCHQTLIGGPMTVTKPFGRNLMDKYGLRMQDVAGLHNAITQAQANGDDSDCDGVGDIAELLQYTDPNVPEGLDGGEAHCVLPEEVRYGCYCTMAPAPLASNAAGLAWLSGLALAGLRRRRIRCLLIGRKA